MKLPKYEGSDIAEASAQFAALQKEAEALVAQSQTRIAEIQARGAGQPFLAGLPGRLGSWPAAAAAAAVVAAVAGG